MYIYFTTSSVYLLYYIPLRQFGPSHLYDRRDHRPETPGLASEPTRRASIRPVQATSLLFDLICPHNWHFIAWNCGWKIDSIVFWSARISLQSTSCIYLQLLTQTQSPPTRTHLGNTPSTLNPRSSGWRESVYNKVATTHCTETEG